jgi:hypothetical protein
MARVRYVAGLWTPTDADARLIAKAARHLANDGAVSGARDILYDLAWDENHGRPKRHPRASEANPVAKRVGNPDDAMCRRIRREEGWRCCYCGRRTIYPKVLEYVARIVGPVVVIPLRGRPVSAAGGPGDVFPFVSDNYPMCLEQWQEPRARKTGPTHTAIERLASAIEHVVPRSRRDQDGRPGDNSHSNRGVSANAAMSGKAHGCCASPG